ncbi:ABC transporter substrate-binding protein [Xanthobacter autotrophicus]|uniref:ABC transporter substrate-binding protein n=1 Tax=Xanthobacter autotrophicus TaxID=280 RepID=UPI0024A6FDE2|nr:ABC transporter substrate-binding protein [Xanthobacter autotrophicus]MDI4656435.1 ABC transporter substrate-binding protein [Xanthobacter autotrophicus]
MKQLAAALLVLMLCASAAQAKPARVASLNLCADELVLRLADPGQVASVTFLARDPRSSNVAALAQEVPVNRGLAEEIVPLAPDLVIVGAFTTRTTTALLRRLGLDVLELGVPQTLDEAYAQIRLVAARLGTKARGEALVGQMEAAFARLPPPVARPPSAIVLRPNGFTAGRGSLPGEVMARAGLDNLAARLSTDRLGQLSLEEVVWAQPDVLVVNAAPDAPPSLADDLLTHPALASFRSTGRSVALPIRLWACAGPELAQAAERLAEAAQRAMEGATQAATQATAPDAPHGARPSAPAFSRPAIQAAMPAVPAPAAR